MASSARQKRWVSWCVLALFWLVQVITVVWFVSYQIMLDRASGDEAEVNFLRTILLWLLATILSGVLVLLLTSPTGSTGLGRRRRRRH